jgi:F-type H+-transporting ATPase subunit delta
LDTEQISASYARALVELAQASGDVEKYGEEMALVSEIVRIYPDFGLFLATPKIAVEVKMAVVEKVFSEAVSETFLSFLHLILERHRGFLFEEIAELFTREVDRLGGRARAFVKTAVPLPEKLADKLKSILQTKLGKKIVFEKRVDPGIIGGLKVRVEDSVLEGTLLSRLRELRKLMKAGKMKGEVTYED